MKILFAGDFYPNDRVANIIKSSDGRNILGEIKPIIENADYAIVNYESPIASNKDKAIDKCGPHLKSTEKGLAICKEAGFDCVALANNHINDYGGESLLRTVTKASEYRLDSVGVGHNREESGKTLYKTIGDETLAVINCCEHEFSVTDENKPGANPLDPCAQYLAIKEACAKADYVVVYVHGGHEHFQYPSIRMVRIYRCFVEMGADAVINAHQHCFSGYEYYNGKPIFYGLGNLCFDWPGRRNKIWNEGYMCMLKMEKGAISHCLFPYRQCDELPKVCLLEKDVFEERIKHINATIAEPALLKSVQDKYYRSSMLGMMNTLEPLRWRLFLGARKRGWVPSLISRKWMALLKDMFLCEAHQDKMNYMMNRQLK